MLLQTYFFIFSKQPMPKKTATTQTPPQSSCTEEELHARQCSFKPLKKLSLDELSKLLYVTNI